MPVAIFLNNILISVKYFSVKLSQRKKLVKGVKNAPFSSSCLYTLPDSFIKHPEKLENSQAERLKF